MVNDWNHLKAYWDQLQVKVQYAAQLSVPPPQNEIDTVVSRAALTSSAAVTVQIMS